MSAEFFTGLGAGSLMGPLLKDAIKTTIAHFFKTRSAQRTEKRKLLREDAATLTSKAEALVVLTLKYFSVPSAQGVDMSRQIRADLKIFGSSWLVIDNRLAEVDDDRMQSQHLIRFRQALTSQLDVERLIPLAFDSESVEALVGASTSIQEALSKIRYSMV